MITETMRTLLFKRVGNDGSDDCDYDGDFGDMDCGVWTHVFQRGDNANDDDDNDDDDDDKEKYDVDICYSKEELMIVLMMTRIVMMATKDDVDLCYSKEGATLAQTVRPPYTLPAPRQSPFVRKKS